MQRNRKEAIDEFLGFVGEIGDERARDLAERLLQRIVEHIWLQHPWLDFQSPAPLEVTLTVAQSRYSLPASFGRLADNVASIRNTTTNSWITLRDVNEFQSFDPIQTGAPTDFTLAGISGVSAQPAPAGEALEVLSDDANDVDVTFTLEGDDATGQAKRMRVTLTGTSPVALGTWTYLDTAGKSLTTTPATEFTTSRGTVTLRVVSDSRVLERWSAEDSATEHRVLSLWPIPTSADTIAIPFMRRVRRLMYDSDPLPGDWWPAVFRGMVLNWRDNTGELQAGPAMWPELVHLIELDNRLRAPKRTRPWGGR